MSNTLLDMACGQEAVIEKVKTSDHATKQRLLNMGLVKGQTVRLERVAPFGDPIEIIVKGYGLAIRKSEAGLIEVSDTPQNDTDHQ